MDFKSYSEKRDKFLKAYGDIVDSRILPADDIDGSTVKQRQASLLDEKFFVSVSGQIKAGKSTLLNALLFGDEILPTDDTPHTAKITFIKYGDKPSLKAVFYDQKEWEHLKNVHTENQDQNEKINYFKAYIEPQIEISIEAGVHPVECIKPNAWERTEDGLDSLAQYVADKGKYTPFVNYVEIYYPLALLRDVTFVDTPGTNDPNPVRSEITLKWISQANANLYITYANRSLDAVDIDFIDHYLLGVHSRSRLVAINKIDTVEDLDQLNCWIDELTRDPDLKARGVFNDRDSIIEVSGLGGLLDKMLSRDQPLSEDMEWHVDRLDELGFLDEKKHKVKFLMAAIEERIIENKGVSILESHQQFISGVFKKKLAVIEQEEASVMQSLDLLKETSLSLAQKKAKCSEVIDRLNLSMKELILQGESLRSKFRVKLRDFLGSRRKHILSVMAGELQHVNDINEFKRIPWLLRENIEREEFNLVNKIGTLTEELAEELACKLEVLEKEIDECKLIDTSLLQGNMKRYGYDVLGEMKKIVDSRLTGETINTVVSEETWFWQRWFNTAAGRKNVALELQIEIEALLKDSLESRIIEKVENRISETFDDGITNNVEIAIRKRVQEIQQEITELEKDDTDREARANLLHSELKSLHTQEQELEVLRNSISADINQL